MFSVVPQDKQRYLIRLCSWGMRAVALIISIPYHKSAHLQPANDSDRQIGMDFSRGKRKDHRCGIVFIHWQRDLPGIVRCGLAFHYGRAYAPWEYVCQQETCRLLRRFMIHCGSWIFYIWENLTTDLRSLSGRQNFLIVG